MKPRLLPQAQLLTTSDVTNADGCSATSAATAITTSNIATPMVTSNGPLEFCDGGSVSLAVPMGYSSLRGTTDQV